MSILTLLTLSAFAQSPPEVSPHGIVLYDLPNYAGDFIVYTDTVTQFPAPWPNDSASSIQLIGGAWADFFTNYDWSGFAFRYLSNAPTLTLDNELSSMAIFGNGRLVHAMLFTDVYHMGVPSIVVTHDSDFSSGGAVSGVDNAIRSVWISEGAEIMLCTDVDFGGDCLHVTQSIDDLSQTIVNGNPFDSVASSARSLIPHVVVWDQTDFGGSHYVVTGTEDIRHSVWLGEDQPMSQGWAPSSMAAYNLSGETIGLDMHMAPDGSQSTLTHYDLVVPTTANETAGEPSIKITDLSTVTAFGGDTLNNRVGVIRMP